jgi:hypothetical protein
MDVVRFSRFGHMVADNSWAIHCLSSSLFLYLPESAVRQEWKRTGRLERLRFSSPIYRRYFRADSEGTRPPNR